VIAVAFSPDGRHVIAGAGNGTLRLWEVASGVTTRVLEGHLSGVSAVAFSPDGRYVVSGSYDGTLRLWNVASAEELARLYGDGYFLATHIAPDGKSLVAGDSGGRVHLIDILIDAADKTAWLSRWGG
jgi:WD40 repeat protein